MKYSVYLIKCPDTLSVVYVGYSSNVEARIKAHKRGSDRFSPHLSSWVSSLIYRGIEPIFEIIFESNIKDEARNVEREYIVYYSNLGILFNNTGNPNKVNRNTIKAANNEYLLALNNASLILAKSVANKYGITRHFIKQRKIY